MYVKIDDVLNILKSQQEPGNIISELKGKLKPLAAFTEEQIATNNIKIVAGEELGAQSMAQPEPEPKNSFDDQLNEVNELIEKKSGELSKLVDLREKIFNSKVEQQNIKERASSRTKPSIHKIIQDFINSIPEEVTTRALSIVFDYELPKLKQMSENPSYGINVITSDIIEQFKKTTGKVPNENLIAVFKKISTKIHSIISERVIAGECPCGCGIKI